MKFCSVMKERINQIHARINLLRLDEMGYCAIGVMTVHWSLPKEKKYAVYNVMRAGTPKDCDVIFRTNTMKELYAWLKEELKELEEMK